MFASSSKSYRERPSKAPATVLLEHSSIDESVSCSTRRNSSPSGSDISLTAVVPGQYDRRSLSSRSQFQRDTSCESAGSSKHNRKAFMIKEKLGIIDYSESHPEKSAADVARDFGMNRTTLFGILKKKDEIRSQATQENLDASRVSKRSSSSPVNNNRSQGRLVDCMLQIPRKPKMDAEPTRQPEPRVIDGPRSGLISPSPRPGLVSPSVEHRRQFLASYYYDDIYTFGVTRKYIGKAHCHDSGCRDGSICSESSTLLILLCANASGTCKKAVPVIVNQNSIILKSEACNGEVIYDKCSYLCSSTFQNWLSVTEMAFPRKILLVVDNTTCDLLKTDKDITNLPIPNTDIIGISGGQSSSLQNVFKSMNSELEKLFNGQFTISRSLTGLACSRNEQYSGKDFEEQIQKAWERIPDEAIRAPILEFLGKVYLSDAPWDSRSPRSLNGVTKPGVEQYNN